MDYMNHDFHISLDARADDCRRDRKEKMNVTYVQGHQLAFLINKVRWLMLHYT